MDMESKSLLNNFKRTKDISTRERNMASAFVNGMMDKYILVNSIKMLSQDLVSTCGQMDDTTSEPF